MNRRVLAFGVAMWAGHLVGCSDDEVTIVRTEPPATATATIAMAPDTPTPIFTPDSTAQPTATASDTVTPVATPMSSATPIGPTTGPTSGPTTDPTMVPTAIPTGVPSATPTVVIPPTTTPDPSIPGPRITYLGITTADDRPIASVGVDTAGRPIFQRVLGSGLNLIVEARPGSDGRPVGISAFSDSGLPDLQILVSRPLGDGSAEVCDVNPEGPNGGVPAIVPPVFSNDTATVDAINDLGCRVNDGTGIPRARAASGDACTRFESGAYAFVDSLTQAQFCLPIALAWAFPTGDTIVTVRVRSISGSIGETRQIVVRIPSPPVPGSPTPTPVPPVLTHFGLVAADDRILAPVDVDAEGRDVYQRFIGHGFSLVVEAAPGIGGRPVGNVAYTDGVTVPDLQILLSRDLGDGDPTVCDVDLENSMFGGVPGIDPPEFSDDPGVIDAINDLGCRVNDGKGAPLGRSILEPCSRDSFGNFTFVNPRSSVQFCLPIARAWNFQDGDTIAVARVRGVDGGLSAVHEIAVRIESLPRDECESGGPGERPFSIDIDASMLLTAGVAGDIGANWVASSSELCAGPGTAGVFPLRLLRDATVGTELPDGRVLCARLIAAGSQGALDCAGEGAHDVRFEVDTEGESELQIGIGAVSGAGAAAIQLPVAFLILEAPATADQCFGAEYGPPIQMAMTTAGGAAAVVNGGETGLEVSAQGENFDCTEWTEPDGVGAFVLPVATAASSPFGESASVLILPE